MHLHEGLEIWNIYCFVPRALSQLSTNTHCLLAVQCVVTFLSLSIRYFIQVAVFSIINLKMQWFLYNKFKNAMVYIFKVRMIKKHIQQIQGRQKK